MSTTLLVVPLSYLFLSSCNAAPAVPAAPTEAAAAVAAEVECRDIKPSTPGPDPTCWNTLKMDDWVREWNVGPQACAQYEPWGNCFMRLSNNGASGIDCLTIYSTKGCYRPVVSDLVGPAEVWYGAWSIWFLHEYLGRLALWDFYHQPEGFSANVPRIVNFLNSDTPWVNDTGLHRLDKGVAKIMDDTWNNDTLNGEHKDSMNYNIDHVLWRTLKQWETGDFLRLAGGGGLLHSPF